MSNTAKSMNGHKNNGWRERTYFNVHFLEREIVKELGARFDFDPSVKKWYTDTATAREELLRLGYTIVGDKHAVVKPQRIVRLTAPDVPLEDRMYFRVPYAKLHIVKTMRGAQYAKPVGLWYVDKNVGAHVDAMTGEGLEVVDDYAVATIAMDRDHRDTKATAATPPSSHTKKKKREEDPRRERTGMMPATKKKPMKEVIVIDDDSDDDFR